MATKKAAAKKPEKAEKKPAAKKASRAESHDSVASAVAAAAESSASKKKKGDPEASASKKPARGAEASASAKKPAVPSPDAERSASLKKAAVPSPDAERSASLKKSAVPSPEAERSASLKKSAVPSPEAERSASVKKSAVPSPDAERSASVKKSAVPSTDAASSAAKKSAVPSTDAASSATATRSAGAPPEPLSLASSGTQSAAAQSFSRPPTGSPTARPSAPVAAPRPAAPKKAAPAAPPTWQTRPITPDLMPRAASRELEAAHQLNWPAKLPDGSIIGIERGKLSESSVLRVGADGTRTPLSKPGQFSSLAVSPDGKHVFGVSGDGKVWSFPATGDASAAVVVFESKRVWGVTPIDAERAVVSEDGTVALMRTTETPWRELDEATVKPISIPLVDTVDSGRWLVVGRSPKIHLFAVLEEQLLPVQSWVQTEGGVSAVDGRVFLYTAGTTTREELLNLAEVHRAL